MYYKQYELSKKIFLNGVSFDTATGQIADRQTEEIRPAGRNIRFRNFAAIF